LKKDGGLWSWGANNYGQVGDGTKTNRASPVRVGHDSDWMALAGGGDYSLAVKRDGTLWHWGLFPSPVGYKVERASLMWSAPAQIGTGTNWAAVFCEEHFAMALQNDGSLWAWGHGPGFLMLFHDPVREPVRVGGALNWKTVAPSLGGTTGISPNGTLWMWATAYTWRPWLFLRNSETQGDDVIQLSNRSNWVATAIVGETVVALSADGGLWELGRPLDKPPGKRRFLAYSRWPRLIADLGTAKGN
jgi:alpha-tubulin suppressor-like RCC1 family protein